MKTVLVVIALIGLTAVAQGAYSSQLCMFCTILCILHRMRPEMHPCCFPTMTDPGQL